MQKISHDPAFISVRNIFINKNILSGADGCKHGLQPARQSLAYFLRKFVRAHRFILCAVLQSTPDVVPCHNLFYYFFFKRLDKGEKPCYNI